jgi:uncharacterized protein
LNSDSELTLILLRETLAICRLEPTDELPLWLHGDFFWFSKTVNETTVVCEQRFVDSAVRHVGNWRCIQVDGQLDFEQTGIIAGISGCLAANKIPIFALSTFDTDYFLVQHDAVGKSLQSLRDAGYIVRQDSP